MALNWELKFLSDPAPIIPKIMNPDSFRPSASGRAQHLVSLDVKLLASTANRKLLAET